MAGHSKWKNIQARKGVQDKRRGKTFTKIAKEITVSARIGGGDSDGNPRLRNALLKARAANMPKDNVDRAVKKGTGELEGITYSEITYEGYGPGGVAFLVETLTDNPNRTVGEVRHAFTRFGGNLGSTGSVAWMFQTKGTIVYEKAQVKDMDRLMEVALEHGAEDVKEDGEAIEITCAQGDFGSLKAALDVLRCEPLEAEIGKLPENHIQPDGKQTESLLKMIDILEDNDDVQNVYHNADLPT